MLWLGWVHRDCWWKPVWLEELLVILLSVKYSWSYKTTVQLLTGRTSSSAADRQEVMRGISDLILSVILFFMATTNNFLLKSTGGSWLTESNQPSTFPYKVY